jgi:MoaA/NifB/PqqE/SkfB family radical SAM enzyme/predicted SAM-dependent methyltransferase/rhamnogalacturonyl hydrolase YesR
MGGYLNIDDTKIKQTTVVASDYLFEMPPNIFAIETTLACDLRCPECAIGGNMIERPKALMTFDRYKIIADKIRPYARYVYLHIWGEPMLNTDIFRMISYTAQFAKTNISTNGMSLTREKAEALIRSGVSDIIVSIDGVSQEAYEQYRVGGNVQKAFDSLAFLNDLNVQYGNKVSISPQFVVFQHNQHEMEEFARICASLGLSPVFKAPYIRNNDSRFCYSDLPAFHRPHFADIPSLRNAMSACPNPREVFTILEDGSVVVCCHDYAGTTSFGNIFQQEVSEIWNSPTYKNFRTEIVTGNAPSFCIENCMTWFLDKQPREQIERAASTIPSQGAIPSMNDAPLRKINLCGGPNRLNGYINIDVSPDADLTIDLEHELLPFPNESMDTVICISAINYFNPMRAKEIIQDVFRVLMPGGVARFATQDLRVLAQKYIDRDRDFFFQKLADGRDRFPGATFADKLNEFFYGFFSAGKHCKYVHDFESLALLFREAGFTLVEQKRFMESGIADIDKIDNRPEQMFFLEAVKGEASALPSSPQTYNEASDTGTITSGSTFRDLACTTWHKGELERAWQYLLKALELNPGDRQAMRWCEEILASMDRRSDLLKLYTDYLTANPDDADVRSAWKRVRATPEKSGAELVSIEQQRQKLEQLNYRRNEILPDLEHLTACVEWLRRAQEANGRGGVSAIYHMDQQRWDVDYPETTGYIIPTFLHYSTLTGDARYKHWAIDMGNWELSIQSPEGGAGEPVGVYGLRPRVFNTGQVMLGWLALYQATGDSKYINAARQAADWIISCLAPDGSWGRGTYQGPRAYKSRVSWALLELFTITGEERYRKGTDSSLQWILAQARPNGWFDNISLSDPHKPWTHLIGYVLVGLLEIIRIGSAHINHEEILKLLHNAAQGIMAAYNEGKKLYGSSYILPATFDPNWQSQDGWSCVTGNAQLEFFLRRLSHFIQDSQLIDTADQIMDDTKRIHLLDGIRDPNLMGGLQGGVPIAAPYASFAIPNWGVKFFADSLLQRLMPFSTLTYLS